MSTSNPQKNARKRLRYEMEGECVNNDSDKAACDAIIPTPSIDLVLQDLATNALSSTAATREEEEEQSIVIQLDDSVEEQQKQSDSNSSDFSDRTKKLKKMQIQPRRQRVCKWKSNPLQKEKTSRSRSFQSTTQKGVLKRPKAQKDLSVCISRNGAPNTSNYNEDDGEIMAAKSPKTLADLLQYSNVISTNLRNKNIITSSESNNDSSTDFTPAHKYPASNKSIATLITDRFRPSRPASYRYPSASVSAPATVHMLTLNARSTKSPFDSTLNNVVAKSAAAVGEPSSSSLSAMVACRTVKPAWPATVPREHFSSTHVSKQPSCATLQTFDYDNGAMPIVMEHDDDVVLLDSDQKEEVAALNEHDQETVESAPFCQNCASQIPFIIKNLDRLDDMVTSMIAVVEGEIQNRRGQQRSNVHHDIQTISYNGQPSSFAQLPSENRSYNTISIVKVSNRDDTSPLAATSFGQQHLNATIVQPQKQSSSLNGNHNIGRLQSYHSSTSSTPLPEKILDDDNSPPHLNVAFEQQCGKMIMP